MSSICQIKPKQMVGVGRVCREEAVVNNEVRWEISNKLCDRWAETKSKRAYRWHGGVGEYSPGDCARKWGASALMYFAMKQRRWLWNCGAFV